MSHGSAVRAVREKMGLRPAEFAKLMGCDKGRIYNIENEHVFVPDEFVTRVCKVAGVSKKHFNTLAMSTRKESKYDMPHAEIERICREADKKAWNL